MGIVRSNQTWSALVQEPSEPGASGAFWDYWYEIRAQRFCELQTSYAINRYTLWNLVDAKMFELEIVLWRFSDLLSEITQSLATNAVCYAVVVRNLSGLSPSRVRLETRRLERSGFVYRNDQSTNGTMSAVVPAIGRDVKPGGVSSLELLVGDRQYLLISTAPLSVREQESLLSSLEVHAWGAFLRITCGEAPRPLVEHSLQSGYVFVQALLDLRDAAFPVFYSCRSIQEEFLSALAATGKPVRRVTQFEQFGTERTGT